MSVIVILLIVSISVASLFLLAFLWAVNNKQFEDFYAPPYRILFDDQLMSKDNIEQESN